MSYSLTKPQPKVIFAVDTKLWLFFTLLVLASFVLFKIVVYLYIARLDSLSLDYANEQAEYQMATSEIEKENIVLLQDIEMVSYSEARNTIIKNSLKKLLSIVPDQIYLTTLDIDATSFHIKGYTPSKELFVVLLQSQLESIFSGIEVTFYPTGNGWFSFECKAVSKQGIDNE
ncbi:hypothetical protein AGMMS50229_03960 [Campylobacterota bacterium]|nr:hypothetical protein AGMMS50229_03960 [Campylobacterota bacterium]